MLDMADEEDGARAEEQQGQPDTSSSSSGPADSQPAAVLEGDAEEPQTEEPQTEEPQTEDGAAGSPRAGPVVDSCLAQFKIRKFFVLRPGTLDQAIKDVKTLVNKETDGKVHSVWLIAEVDHWNNEKERLALITDNSLLVLKYDFMMLNVDQIQRIPLNFVDRISHGTFSFPKHSLLQREGEGVRVFWDRLREPTFVSRWNPFTTDFPFITFTQHPVSNISDAFAALCDIEKFCEQLREAAQKSHTMQPVPGKANGVMLLKQSVHIEAYVGAMSFLGNQNKLGYCMARGNIGF